MTEILVNTALFLVVVFALTYTPWVKGLRYEHAPMFHQVAFVLLVLDLYLFSLNETIRETGLLYGFLFSMIPLAVGAVVFCAMRNPDA